MRTLSETLKEKILKVRDIEAENHIEAMYVKPSHQVRKQAIMRLMFSYVNGASFLDVGCAEGFYCNEAMMYGAKSVVGVDVSQSKINRAREMYPLVEFKVSDSDNLSFYSTSSFDFILCAETLQHILDYKKTLKEMVSIMSDSGLLLITVPNLSKTHKHEFAKIDVNMSIETLLDEIGGAGHGKQNAIWKFDTDVLSNELVSDFNLKIIQRVQIDTPDGMIKNLWTIFLCKKGTQ